MTDEQKAEVKSAQDRVRLGKSSWWDELATLVIERDKLDVGDCAQFPVNPPRDKNGNAVLFPGMVRYEGVAAIFGGGSSDQFVILSPTVGGLHRALYEMEIAKPLDLSACRIATLEPIPEYILCDAAAADAKEAQNLADEIQKLGGA
jgi:hypothetical protein